VTKSSASGDDSPVRGAPVNAPRMDGLIVFVNKFGGVSRFRWCSDDGWEAAEPDQSLCQNHSYC
jgi:hypothetical protein